MIDQPKPKAAAPASGFTVQFFLKHGTMVQWPVPAADQFNFAVLVSNIRSAGFFMMGDVYIPADEIAVIGLWAQGKPISARIQLPEHGTKQ